jgi:hypothetical protein
MPILSVLNLLEKENVNFLHRTHSTEKMISKIIIEIIRRKQNLFDHPNLYQVKAVPLSS